MHIVVTGGTGFLGTSLLKDSASRPDVSWTILTRGHRQSDNAQVEYVQWDGSCIPASVRPADVVINLAGFNIGEHSWSDKNRERFLSSRLNATTACVEWIKQSEQPPSVFLSASAVGLYGSNRTEHVTESSAPGDDFLADLCQQWEAASEGAGVRTVLLRTSVILSAESGPLASMLTPFKLGVGGVIGSGEQGFPWMHIDDYVAAVWFVIEHEAAEGPINFVAPEVIDNKQMTRSLARVLRRPAWFRVPKMVLKLGLGERSILLWGGQKVEPAALQALGFSFRFPTFEPAIRDLVK